jgi:hypothetical protein
MSNWQWLSSDREPIRGTRYVGYHSVQNWITGSMGKYGRFRGSNLFPLTLITVEPISREINGKCNKEGVRSAIAYLRVVNSFQYGTWNVAGLDRARRNSTFLRVPDQSSCQESVGRPRRAQYQICRHTRIARDSFIPTPVSSCYILYRRVWWQRLWMHYAGQLPKVSNWLPYWAPDLPNMEIRGPAEAKNCLKDLPESSFSRYGHVLGNTLGLRDALWLLPYTPVQYKDGRFTSTGKTATSCSNLR